MIAHDGASKITSSPEQALSQSPGLVKRGLVKRGLVKRLLHGKTRTCNTRTS